MIRLMIIDYDGTPDSPDNVTLDELTELGRQEMRYSAERLIEEIDEYEAEHRDDEDE